MKSLLDNLDAVVAHKQAVINNSAAYHYVAQVPYEHKLHAFKGCKWSKHGSETRYRPEPRFDQGRFDRDVNNAEQNIQNCKNNIERTINSAKVALSNLEQSNSANNNESSLLIQKLQHFQSQYQIKCQNAQTLERELRVQVEKASYTSSQVNQQRQIVSNLPVQINAMERQIASHEVQLAASEAKLACANEQFLGMQAALRSQFESLSNEQRAYIFAETYGTEGKEFILEIIDTIGFDTVNLGYYAITRGNKELIEIALDKGVNFGSCSYNDGNGKTLLQHLVSVGNQELISFVISLEDQDFATTLSVSIEQSDLQTIKAILSYNPYLLSDLNQSGYSLLQVAIASNRTEIVELLLELDTNMVDILSSDMESAFAIALRQNNSEIIKTLLSVIDISREVEVLEARGNIHLLENLKNSDFELGEDTLALINKMILGESGLELAINEGNDIELIALLENYDI